MLRGPGNFRLPDEACAAIGNEDSSIRSTGGRERLYNPQSVITRFAMKNGQNASASLRILVAEDNAVNQKLIVRLLEKRGHSVQVVPNGRDAVEILAGTSFDLVLMDMQMQVMDGFEATIEIRKREEHGGVHLPIIALTAYAMKGDRERCLTAGMDGYLTKPIRGNELDDVLNQYIGLRVAGMKTTPEEKISSLKLIRFRLACQEMFNGMKVFVFRCSDADSGPLQKRINPRSTTPRMGRFPSIQQ